ncbi:hypothetical protein ABID22_002211 [Pontibacter aydingkolensis]|uniref:Uncharacterized protein n=1 Tax=Pontibacter aydingkolensis TaxID=1911536 RepID=A0ABS7CWD4_9BACT|nr:hypothetical protein [Pontibacter aydingkolensis]MBW7467817.1 hypothetical protein [Pontibacter aydingkolensis]
MFRGRLAGQEGAIVHLGNPVLEGGAEGGLSVLKITDWECRPTKKEPSSPGLGRADNSQPSRFKLLINYQIEVSEVIRQALNASPDKTAHFIAYVQLGTDAGQLQETSPVGFWTLHDTKGLAWNTLYRLRA